MSSPTVATEPPERRGDGPGVGTLRIATSIGLVALIQVVLVGTAFLVQAQSVTPSMVVISPKASWAGYVANRINLVEGHPVRAFVGTTTSEAQDDLLADRTHAVLLVDPTQPTDTLTISSAQGQDAAAQIRTIVQSVQQTSGRRVMVQDGTPPSSADPQGRHGYHLALCWLIGGLIFALLTRRTRRTPGSHLRFAGLSAVTGVLTSAIAVGMVAIVIPGWAVHIGQLVALGVVAFTMSALLTAAVLALGTVWLGPGVLAATLIAARPAAAGAQGFGRTGVLWQPIGPWTPPGLTVSAVRRVVYLDTGVPTTAWAGFAWWIVAALLIALMATASRPGASPAKRR